MVGVVAAVVLSVGLGALAVRLGPVLGYVDVPDDPTLKAHVRPAVPLGGVAIFMAVHVGWALLDSFDIRFFVASAALVGLGLVDDRLHLSPQVRLLIELLVAIFFAAGTGLGLAASILVGLVVVISVNAVNIFDGLDGVAAVAALLSAGAVAVYAVMRDDTPWPALVVAGALFGFLLLNWHPARLFMGDNGSYVLGLFLVALFVEPAGTVQDLLVGMGLLGLFLVELGSTLLRRAIAGVGLFGGDRNHLYDRLPGSTVSVPTVAIIVGVIHAGILAIVLLLDALAPRSMAVVGVAVVGVAALVFATVRSLRRKRLMGAPLPDA